MAQSLADKVASFAASTPDWQIADALNAPDATANGTTDRTRWEVWATPVNGEAFPTASGPLEICGTVKAALG